MPAVPDLDAKDASVVVPLDFPAVTGRDLRFVIDRVRTVKTVDWVSKQPVAAPVGIAELGAPGLRAAVPTGAFDSGCRDDLVTVDGDPVTVQIRGDVADAVAGGGDAPDALRSGRGAVGAATTRCARPSAGTRASTSIASCSARAADGRPEGPGRRPTRTRPQRADRRDRRSRSRSRAARRRPSRSRPATSPRGSCSARATAPGGRRPPAGATSALRRSSTGTPTAGCCRPEPIPLTVELRWTPQRVVFGGLIASGLAVIACLVVVVIGLRRRRRPRAVSLHAGR